MKRLEGTVALVVFVSPPQTDQTGREVAVRLAALGARVVTCALPRASGGPDDAAIVKQVAEIVGEIAAAGGKARLVAGPTATLAAAVARCHEAFGGLDLAFAEDASTVVAAVPPGVPVVAWRAHAPADLVASVVAPTRPCT